METRIAGKASRAALATFWRTSRSLAAVLSDITSAATVRAAFLSLFDAGSVVAAGAVGIGTASSGGWDGVLV